MIGDETINSIPFAALSTDGRRYLIDDFEVFYSPSLSVYLLDLQGSKSARTGPATFLGLGGVDYGKYRSQARSKGGGAADEFTKLGIPIAKVRNLPETRREVRACSKLFGGHRVLLEGDDARPDEVRTRYLTDFDFLHVAGHAFIPVTPGESMNPILLLQPSEDSNGIMNADEFRLGRQLDSYLVTLSACDTGRGRSISLEGVDSLANSFLIGGAENVLASLWQLEDTATRQFMVRFYREMLAGKRPAQALQLTQRWMRTQTIRLSSRRGLEGSYESRITAGDAPSTKIDADASVEVSARHPFFWAAFGLFGSNRTVDFITPKTQPPLGSTGSPIRANQPIGQREYLDRLLCPGGERPKYRRAGNVGIGVYGNIVDKYRVECPDRSPDFIYMDYYFPGYRERRAPEGFSLRTHRDGGDYSVLDLVQPGPLMPNPRPPKPSP